MWHCYFLLKIYFGLQGVVQLHAVANVALAALCYWPINHRVVARVRWILAIVLSIALLVYEEILPSIEQWSVVILRISEFSLVYWVELLNRLLSTSGAQILVGSALVLVIVARRIRLEPWVLLFLVAMSFSIHEVFHSHTNKQDVSSMDFQDKPTHISKFWQEQSGIEMPSIATPTEITPDVALLHVCSLSWDDLREVGRSDSQFLDMFDLTLGQFNSATSYSGPAMLRLVNSGCGQSSHDQLFDINRSQCNLLQQLNQAGFETQVWLNHSGQFDHFLESLQARSPVRVQTSQDFPAIERSIRAFDGSELIDDEGILSHWWQEHDSKGKPRFLYFNTISLHDGNRSISASSTKPIQYQVELQRLMHALGNLMERAKTSERGLLIVLIPEHGAALRPQGIELSGLRNTPWPTITHVPVGVRFVNKNHTNVVPTLIQIPTSYSSLSTLLSQVLSSNDPGATLLSSALKLPPIQWVADNGDKVLAWHNDFIWTLNPQDEWTPQSAGRRIALPIQ